MPPKYLVDIDNIDMDKVQYDAEAIEAVNPHRFEMRMIDGITYMDVEAGEIIAFKDVRDDEFWVRGHIPGRPIFPGVLMIEAAAQMSSFGARHALEVAKFIGFGGIKDVKFRHQVIPGDRLYILGKFIEVRPRRFTMSVQGLVNGKMTFQATVVGMPI